jgi:hypothetical protein
VKIGKLSSGPAECPEILYVVNQWKSGQRFLQIVGERLAVLRTVKKTVNVIEDIFLADVIALLRARTFENEIANAVAANIF